MTSRTLFQAGSISKPVAAAGALALVEQGKLALDEDVNQKLKTWKVPDNGFTKTEKVTLRRLMSHTAGLTVHGFPGYDVDAPSQPWCRSSMVRSRRTQRPSEWTCSRHEVALFRWRSHHRAAIDDRCRPESGSRS